MCLIVLHRIIVSPEVSIVRVVKYIHGFLTTVVM
jgi:hypothetical protein